LRFVHSSTKAATAAMGKIRNSNGIADKASLLAGGAMSWVFASWIESSGWGAEDAWTRTRDRITATHATAIVRYVVFFFLKLFLFVVSSPT
jgi:hypothetical protein